MNISEILRPRIWQDLGRFFVDLESGVPRPPLPFISHKLISYVPQAKSETHTFDGENVVVKQTEHPLQTLSLSVYADTQAEAQGVALALKDWFDFTGREYLSENGIVVVRIENIQDRTVFLETDYEFRVGFDVILRTKREVTKKIEHIETTIVNNERIGE